MLSAHTGIRRELGFPRSSRPGSRGAVLNVVFSFIHAGKTGTTRGPFSALRLDAETLRDAMTGALVARHRDHQWEIGGERYFRLDTTSAVKIHFEMPSRRSSGSDHTSREYGPYQQFSSVDGIAYVEGRVFAFIDNKVGDWFSYGEGRHWAVMVVNDAGIPKGGNQLLSALAAIAPLLPGVLGLWHGARLARLATTGCLRELMQRMARERGPCNDITAVTWEAHPDPGARRAELLREYEDGGSSLPDTYGSMHGNLVRTRQLIDQARKARSVARSLRAAARNVREAVKAALPEEELAADSL